MSGPLTISLRVRHAQGRWTVAPQIKTVEQPVQFLNRQNNGFIRMVRGRFESFGFEALEPKAEAIALAIEDFRKRLGNTP
jgi:hypothetical protein